MTKAPAALIVLLVLCLPSTARSQDAAALLELSLSDLLATQAVTGARHDQRVVDSPRAIAVITAEDIRQRNYRSTPEALAESLGIFVQQTNDGGGSPIIRGFVGNHILVLVDGVRLNNATFRLGPNQYLNTIDINQVERIEVMRGAASVLYGSDAVGGVVHIITRTASRTGPPVRARFSSRFSSANTGAVGRGEISAYYGPLSFAGGASLKQFGQLRGGRDTGVQPLTGFDEWDADGKLTVALPAKQQFTLAGQKVSQDDVHRPDVVQAGTLTDMWWHPQARALGYAQYDAAAIPGPIERATILASVHQQSERYTRILVTAPTIERRHYDETTSYAASLQLSSSIGPRHLVTYGLEAQRDTVESRRDDVSSVTGATRAAKGVFANGSSYTSWAAFVQDEYDVSPRLHVNVGARYSTYQPDATVTEEITGDVRVDRRSDALTGTAYGLFRLTSGLDLVGGVAQGFRAPNIDDLSILAAFGGGYEVPNPSLRPERSVSAEAGIRGRRLRFAGASTFFLTDVDGMIQREAGLFRGLTFIDIDGDQERGRSEPLVFQRQNAGRGRMHGVELEGRWTLAPEWTLAGTLVRMIGREQTTGEPLRRVPPAHGTARVGWTGSGRTWVEGYSFFAARQARLAQGDIEDIRIPPGGTPGFVTLNLRGGVRLRPDLQVTTGLENITNQSYRMHGSGIDGAGTNLVLGVEWMF